MLLKTVIHVHTNYSYDGNASPADVLRTARRQRVDCIAVTDHDTIAGARELAAIGGVRVIVGEEISTSGGDVIGLFLQERIPPGLSIEDTARAIRQQRGLVLAPHPFASTYAGALGAAGLERLRPWMDAVETCNAQSPCLWDDRKAARWSREHGVIPYMGADTHIRRYLDGCYQLLPAFDGPQEFLRALRVAELRPGRFGPEYLARMALRHVWDKVFDWRLPGFGVNAPDSAAPQPDLAALGLQPAALEIRTN